jgi:hypothetical protein
MPDNATLRIDEDTQDLVFASGGLTMIDHEETTAQCVRLTLTAHKGDFFLDTTHGTEWSRILGRKQSDLEDDEADEVLRAGILQETDIAYVENLAITREGRNMNVTFDGTLRDGAPIRVEVNLDAV